MTWQAWRGAVAARRDATAVLDRLAARSLLRASGLPATLPLTLTLQTSGGPSTPLRAPAESAYSLALRLAAFKACKAHMQACACRPHIVLLKQDVHNCHLAHVTARQIRP